MTTSEWPALTWKTAPRKPVFDADEVHIWRKAIKADGEAFATLEGILNAEERARAARYISLRDRNAFVVARGTMRRILGSYLSRAPQTLRFDYNRFGKPYLCNSGEPPLQFNVSHSGAVALYAFSVNRQVGIDVEQFRHGIELDSIAQLYFTAVEAEELRSLPVEHQLSAFYRCWVRKEAYLKATGKGLSLRMDEFEVPVALDIAPCKVLANESAPGYDEWWLRDLPLSQNYAAALVVRGINPEVKCWICPAWR